MAEIKGLEAANLEETTPSQVSGKMPSERPWVFGFLIAPIAVLSNGVIGGALSYLLRQQGVGPARIAEIISLLMLPQSIYFLWSPITDFWIRRRTWLMVAATFASIAMLAAFKQPSLSSVPAIALMFLSACMGQLIVASCGGLMGTLKSEVSRRRASSFYQAGSLAFGAIAVSVLLFLSLRLSLGVLGWIMAALIALPSLSAFAAPEQRTVSEHGLGKTLVDMFKEIRGTFFAWRAIPYILLLTFPMASGAMISLLPGLAQDFQISGDQVAWINGIAGALLVAAGSLCAALIPARVRGPVAYLSVGLINAAALSILWFGPSKPGVYLVGTVLYLFTIGAGYALSTVVALEFMGGSGKSGSSRYAIINSLINIPVIYTTWLDGKGYAIWGTHGMPAVDVVISSVGATILLAFFLSKWGRQIKATVEVPGVV
jgi:hypothetical protein